MLPQAPQFPQGQDKIRGADGTECSRSTAPRKRYADIGFLGGNTSGTGGQFGYGGSTDNSYGQQGGAIYGRITFNLDAENYNVDCGRLYELELERLRVELEQAKMMGVGKPVGVK